MARRVAVERAPLDVSPKVLVPVVVQLIGAVVLAIVTGEVDEEALGVAASALVTALLGYFTYDQVEV